MGDGCVADRFHHDALSWCLETNVEYLDVAKWLRDIVARPPGKEAPVFTREHVGTAMWSAAAVRRLVSLEIRDTSISRQPDAVDPRQRNAPGRQVAQRSSSRLPAKRPAYDAEPQALADQPLTVSTDKGIYAPPRVAEEHHGQHGSSDRHASHTVRRQERNSHRNQYFTVVISAGSANQD